MCAQRVLARLPRLAIAGNSMTGLRARFLLRQAARSVRRVAQRIGLNQRRVGVELPRPVAEPAHRAARRLPHWLGLLAVVIGEDDAVNLAHWDERQTRFSRRFRAIAGGGAFAVWGELKAVKRTANIVAHDRAAMRQMRAQVRAERLDGVDQPGARAVDHKLLLLGIGKRG